MVRKYSQDLDHRIPVTYFNTQSNFPNSNHQYPKKKLDL